MRICFYVRSKISFYTLSFKMFKSTGNTGVIVVVKVHCKISKDYKISAALIISSS